MVREARYAWNDEENTLGLPDRRDRFDDLDDALLDPYIPKAAGDKAAPQAGGKGNLEARDRRVRKSELKHLADADWLDDAPPDEPASV